MRTGPLFWLGDTARFVFGNLDREECTKYLWDRRNQELTVEQASLHHFDAARLNALGDPRSTTRTGVGPTRHTGGTSRSL